MFKEIANTKLHVDPPEFCCDNIISETIEEPLPNTAFFMGLMGSAGSGKTSLMVNLLTMDGMYKRSFDHIHLICPEASMSSLKDDIWKSHPAEKIHHSLDMHTLLHIEKKAKERKNVKPKAETTLMVIDDMTIFLKQKGIEEKLRGMVFNRRHMMLSIMILVQSYIAMPLDLRKTLSHFFLFKPRNKKEAEAIWEEIMFFDKKTASQLLRFVFQEPYDFLMGNCNTGQMYRNFNEIEVHEPEDLALGNAENKKDPKSKPESSSDDDD